MEFFTTTAAKQIPTALRLPAFSRPDKRALDLGSMRAGGATHLQMLLEDAELTRRRGRWLSARTMEIYIQESSATMFFPQLPPETKEIIMQAANGFPKMLAKNDFLYEEPHSTSNMVYSVGGAVRKGTDGKRWEAWRKFGWDSIQWWSCETGQTERSKPETKRARQSTYIL